MTGVLFGFDPGPFGNVWLFLPIRAGDPVVLHARIDSNSIGMDIVSNGIQIEIEADVPIEFPVIEIAGIAFHGTPHLFGGIRIASEGGYAGRTPQRGIDAILGPHGGMRDAVGFKDGIADAEVGQDAIDTRVEAAFGQPESLGRAPEKLRIEFHSDANLSAHRRFVECVQRQVRVRRGTGDHLDFTEILKAFKRVHQVAAVPVDIGAPHLQKELLVHAGESLELRLVAGADDFPASEFDRLIEPRKIALPQKRVEEHGRERGGERKSQTEIDAVFDEAFERHEQPHVGFGDGFE